MTALPPYATIPAGDESTSPPGLEGSHASVVPSGAPSSDERSRQTTENARRSPTRGVSDGVRGGGGGAERGRGEGGGADSGSKVRVWVRETLAVVTVVQYSVQVVARHSFGVGIRWYYAMCFG